MPTTVPNRPSSGAADGDGAQRVQVALDAVHRAAAGVLERLAQRVLGDARFGDHAAQAGGQHAAEHRVLGQLVDDVGRRQAGARDAQHLVEQGRRRDPRRRAGWYSRSMTSASATMEQTMSGQIGQPAACMIENKGGFRGVAQDGGRLWTDARRTTARTTARAAPSSTALWITLWVTRRGAASRAIARPGCRIGHRFVIRQHLHDVTARDSGMPPSARLARLWMLGPQTLALALIELLQRRAARPVWGVAALLLAAATRWRRASARHRARRALGLHARGQRPLLLHAEGRRRRRRAAALRDVPPRGGAARLRAGRRPAGRTARPAGRLRAARRAAVRRRVHAARRRRQPVRAVPAPARAAARPRACSTPRASGRSPALPRASASSPRCRRRRCATC